MKIRLLVCWFIVISHLSIAGEIGLFEMRPVPKNLTETAELYSLPPREGRSEAILVEPVVLLDRKAIKSASVERGSENTLQIRLKFTEAGTKQFADITKKYLGERLAIFADGGLRSAPVIRDQMLGGEAIISGNFTEVEAATLAAKINSIVAK